MNVSPLNPHVVASDIAPERLAKNPKLTEQQKIAEASRQFESILLKQILESSQKTVIKSKLSNDSTASSIYHDMVTTRLADSISKSGSFGLSKTFEQQLNRPHGPRPNGLPQKENLAGLHSAVHALKPLPNTHGSAGLKPLHSDSHGRDARATTTHERTSTQSH
jgi:Rod binding domain-containing protein